MRVVFVWFREVLDVLESEAAFDAEVSVGDAVI